MKKIFIGLASLSVALFAGCPSGCTDSPLPHQLSFNSQTTFTQLEQKIAMKIEEINDVLSSQINATEERNKKETANLLNLQKQKSLKQKHKAFLYTQQNKLQGNINSVWSVENGK